MRRFASLLMATSSLVVLAAETHAADLTRALPAKAPFAAPARVIWTGCYIGANVGFGSSRNSYSPDPTAVFLPAEAPGQTINGVVAGGQVGCDYQFDPFVVGIQGMGDWTSMSGTGDPYTLGKTLKASVPWLATLTARAGYAVQPNVLVYVKGGAAWARTDFDFKNGGVTNGNANVTRTGWTVGGGLEWMFTSNWSVFVEYNHLDFGDRLEQFSNIGGIVALNMNYKQTVDMGQIGVNYRFNWWR